MLNEGRLQRLGRGFGVNVVLELEHVRQRRDWHGEASVHRILRGHHAAGVESLLIQYRDHLKTGLATGTRILHLNEHLRHDLVLYEEALQPEVQSWFARAIGDANPRWLDEADAANRQYGSVTAPPTLMLTIGLDQIEQELTALPSMAILHGSTELECIQAVKAGDNISVTIKLANLRERSGKDKSTMVFMTFELIYKNQKQELVAECRQTLIGY